jgi:hypothetical protein
MLMLLRFSVERDAAVVFTLTLFGWSLLVLRAIDNPTKYNTGIIIGFSSLFERSTQRRESK